MNVNLNNYGYSRAIAVETILKKPLFRLVSNAAFSLSAPTNNLLQLIKKIVKVAFHCLLAIALFIPAGMVWLLGKAISKSSKSHINYNNLHLAPPKIQVPENLASDSTINLSILSKKYDALNIPETLLPDQISKKVLLGRLCIWVAKEDRSIYPDDSAIRTRFCKETSTYLKGIIRKIQSGEISPDGERDILLELAEASTRCYPTWLEVASKIYDEFNDQPETAEVKLLRLIQDYKESITLEFCQQEAGTQWHALNVVRNILGNELGFNTALNALDPYAVQDSVMGKSLVKWLFMQRYENVNRLVTSIQSNINMKPYDSSYYELLVSILKNQGVPDTDANTYVQEHFYNEDDQLNRIGVNVMLKSMGILR
jgi:hypothetical protein